jgi:hypothetical protein
MTSGSNHVSGPVFEQHGNKSVQNNVSGKRARVKIVNKAPYEAPPSAAQTFEVARSLTLPFKSRGLGIVSLISSLASVAMLIPAFWPIVEGILAKPSSRPLPIWIPEASVVVIAIGIVLAATAWGGRRMIKLRQRHLFSWAAMPAIEAVGDTLCLVRYTGTCAQCGGKLSFLSIPTDWHFVRSSNGGSRKVVDETAFFAQCVRNRKHQFEISSAVESA